MNADAHRLHELAFCCQASSRPSTVDAPCKTAKGFLTLAENTDPRIDLTKYAFWTKAVRGTKKTAKEKNKRATGLHNNYKGEVQAIFNRYHGRNVGHVEVEAVHSDELFVDAEEPMPEDNHAEDPNADPDFVEELESDVRMAEDGGVDGLSSELAQTSLSQKLAADSDVDMLSQEEPVAGPSSRMVDRVSDEVAGCSDVHMSCEGSMPEWPFRLAQASTFQKTGKSDTQNKRDVAAAMEKILRQELGVQLPKRVKKFSKVQYVAVAEYLLKQKGDKKKVTAGKHTIKSDNGIAISLVMKGANRNNSYVLCNDPGCLSYYGTALSEPICRSHHPVASFGIFAAKKTIRGVQYVYHTCMRYSYNEEDTDVIRGERRDAMYTTSGSTGGDRMVEVKKRTGEKADLKKWPFELMIELDNDIQASLLARDIETASAIRNFVDPSFHYINDKVFLSKSKPQIIEKLQEIGIRFIPCPYQGDFPLPSFMSLTRTPATKYTVYFKLDLNALYAGKTRITGKRLISGHDDAPKLYCKAFERTLIDRDVFYMDAKHQHRAEEITIWACYLGFILGLQHRFQKETKMDEENTPEPTSYAANYIGNHLPILFLNQVSLIDFLEDDDWANILMVTQYLFEMEIKQQ